MHIRRVKVRSGGKTYVYPQLVRSYRREDGMPAHEVVASLKDFSEQEIEQLDVALKAARGGTRVVETTTDLPDLQGCVVNNLSYLDVAVLWEMWNQWNLTVLLDNALEPTGSDVSPALVIAALTLQRSVSPASKLAAEDWFQRTALPELLDMQPAKFNNSRFHRVLEQLEAADEEIQNRLIRRYLHHDGAFATLFMDATDTYFCGTGPSFAQKGKTKEGRYAPKIGILLVCNEKGFPLRWKCVEGRAPDNLVFHDVLEQLQGVDWAADVPVVCDRSMGATRDIERMGRTRLRFLTAIRRPEFSTYAGDTPLNVMGRIDVSLDPRNEAEDVERLTAALNDEDRIVFVKDNLWVLDRGVTETGVGHPATENVELNDDGSIHQALKTGRQIRQLYDEGRVTSQREAARVFDVSTGWIRNRLDLLKLTNSIQADIEAGQAEQLSLTKLKKIARLPLEKQFEVYRRTRDESTSRPPPTSTRLSPATPASRAGMQLRIVITFNPRIHLDQRRRLHDKVDEIYAHIEERNRSFVSGNTRSGAQKLAGRARDFIRKKSLTDLFDVVVIEDASGGPLQLELDGDALKRRQNTCGVAILVAHPELSAYSGADLARMYREKNTVEADFKTIKSCLKIQPVYHQTDEKVRAHVTLCMLALLLERTLRTRLDEGATESITARRCLDVLSSCHLNRLELSADEPTTYTLTRLTREQKQYLKLLDLEHLGDDNEMTDRISAR